MALGAKGFWSNKKAALGARLAEVVWVSDSPHRDRAGAVIVRRRIMATRVNMTRSMRRLGPAVKEAWPLPQEEPPRIRHVCSRMANSGRQTMAGTAKKTDPKLWERVKAKITKGSKGGEPDQWSARKAQMAVQEYKKQGGGYEGGRSGGNHLRQWQDEDWGTKSGRRSKDTGERYLPHKAREKLTSAEYSRTTEKKRADTGKGKQFSQQPRDIAKKTAAARKSPQRATGGPTKAALMERARKQGIAGRSRMSKAELERALR